MCSDKIPEQLRLEGTSGGYLVQRSTQAGPFTVVFEYCRGWSLHNFTGQPVSGLGHRFYKKVYSDVQREPPLLQFVLLGSSLVTGTTTTTLAPSSLCHCTLLLSIYIHWQDLLELSLLQAEQSLNSWHSFFSLSSQTRYPRAFSIFMALC